MPAHAYVHTATIQGVLAPQEWAARATRSAFGDVALVLFLLAQCLDGALTYVGVVSIGPWIEANPIISALMAHFGHGAGLAGAKVVASGLGIYLHVWGLHAAVALLTAFYVAAAIVPWTALLFF